MHLPSCYQKCSNPEEIKHDRCVLFCLVLLQNCSLIHSSSNILKLCFSNVPCIGNQTWDCSLTLQAPSEASGPKVIDVWQRGLICILHTTVLTFQSEEPRFHPIPGAASTCSGRLPPSCQAPLPRRGLSNPFPREVRPKSHAHRARRLEHAATNAGPTQGRSSPLNFLSAKESSCSRRYSRRTCVS